MRKSVTFFPQNHMVQTPSFESAMLHEDLIHRVFPTGYRSSRTTELSINIEPFSDEIYDCLSNAFFIHEPDKDLDSAVRSFVEHSIHMILYQSEVFFELVFDNISQSKAFLITPLPLGEVRIDNGTVVQFIPPQVQEARGLHHPFVEIPEMNILHFSFPESLGGMAGIGRLISDFESFGGSLLPKFAEDDYERTMQEFGNALLKEYHNTREMAIATSSSSLGWACRNLWNNKITEYYSVYRQLKFARSAALIREHILLCLNEFISKRALPRFGLEGNITITGVPDSNDLNTKLKELSEGTLSFKDALDYVYGF